MNEHMFFSIIMNKCNWKKQGHDEKILAPLIKFLSEQNDDEIFLFDDIMQELLYKLDTRKNFKRASKYYKHSDDTFLYSRCVALINGEEYYKNVKSGKIKDVWTMEFEAILYVPMKAWAMKHNTSDDDYPHLSPLSCETRSNKDEWKWYKF